MTTAPNVAGRCQLGATNSSSSFPATGGSGTVTIAAARDCTWSVASQANWIAISGAHEGQGDASVAYGVAPNPVPAARSAAIAVGATQLPVSQAAAACTFTLSEAGTTVGASGGRVAFDVSTLTGCGWTASSDAAWIAIVSGAWGSASGTVVVSISENPGAARVGHVTAGGRAYTVSQAPATSPAPPAPDPAPALPSAQKVHLEGVVFDVTVDGLESNGNVLATNITIDTKGHNDNIQ